MDGRNGSVCCLSIWEQIAGDCSLYYIFDKNGVFTLSDLMRYLLGLKNAGQSHENKTERNYLMNAYIRLYAYFYSLFRNRSLILMKRA